MSTEKSKQVEAMIVRVMKKKELTRNAAMDYMLAVATGRLSALWRYEDSVPEGKKTKGVFELRARKKVAEKTAKIDALRVVSSDEPKAQKPKAQKPKASKPKASKPKPKKKAQKPDKSEPSKQLEIVAAE